MKSRTTGIQTSEAFEDLLEQLRGADTIAVDLETSDLLQASSTYIVGWCFSVKEGVGYYIPVGHDFGDQLKSEDVISALKPILEDASKTFVFHNAKFDIYFVHRDGIGLPVDRVEDTMLEAYSLGDGYERFGLDFLTEKVFQHKKVKFSELFPKKLKEKNIGTVPIEEVISYGGEDADYTLRLHNKFFPRATNHPIYKIERKLWPVVGAIEQRGVLVDREYCLSSSERIHWMIEETQEIIYAQFKETIGEECRINIGSYKALQEVLFDKMKLPSRGKTKGGGRSTSEETMKKLATDYPVCQNILSYRSMKSNSTVMENMATSWLGEDGRVHTSYNQTGATSGRFSSEDPNVQNISKGKSWTIINLDGSTKTLEMFPRAAFVSGPGCYLIELDFSAVEYLIIAAEANEMSVLDAYRSGRDVHAQTASDMYHTPYEDVTPQQRGVAKMMAYLMLYGGSASGIEARTDLTEIEAEDGFRMFFQARPQLAKYIKSVRDRSKITKTVSTKFGRKQVVPEYFLPGQAMLARAERSSVSRIIQGTAADIHKIGLVRSNTLNSDAQQCILQTHDSQTWLVHRSVKPQELIPKLIDRMSPEIPGYPRIRVDAELGYDWGNLYSYDETADYSQLFQGWEDNHNTFLEDMKSDSSLDLRRESVVELESEENLFSGPVRLDADLGVPNLTEEYADLLKSVLGSFPGENVVFVKTDSMEDWVALKAVPTRLNVDELKDALKPKFPNISLSVNRKTLLASIFPETGV